MSNSTQYVVVNDVIRNWLAAGLLKNIDEETRKFMNDVIAGLEPLTPQMYLALPDICGRPPNAQFLRKPIEEELADMGSRLSNKPF